MENKKIKVLFVCLGNICRSPAAEAIFLKKIANRGITDKFIVDSAGLNGYHNGEPADSRMRSHAKRRGYEINSRSRKISRADFEFFDHIIGMDNSNISILKSLTCNNEEICKISKMTDHSPNNQYDSVPDPYYGGSDGFENVLDILEECTDSLINNLES